MAVDIKLPGLGEGVDSGDVLEVFVSVGDMVEKNETLVELETDKATVNIPADIAGKITAIHVNEGDTVSVGSVMVSIEPSDAAAPAPAAPAPAPAAPPTPPPAPTPDPPAAAAPPTPPAPAPAPTPTPAAPAAPAPVTSNSGAGASVAAGPAMRRLAREVGIDLNAVSGTGESGRITRDDIMKVVRGSGGRVATSGGTAGGTGQSDAFGPVRVEKMPKIRQTIARKMHESWETCPRVTNFDDADVTDLEALRQNNKADYAEPVSYTHLTLPTICSV